MDIKQRLVLRLVEHSFGRAGQDSRQRWMALPRKPAAEGRCFFGYVDTLRLVHGRR